MFLPVLPTTPFLLLTAVCWMRGSQRLYQRLMTHPVLGKYISDIREHRSIPHKTKIITIATLWLTIATSAVFFVESWWIRILLCIVAISVTIHILSFKSS